MADSFWCFIDESGEALRSEASRHAIPDEEDEPRGTDASSGTGTTGGATAGSGGGAGGGGVVWCASVLERDAAQAAGRRGHNTGDQCPSGEDEDGQRSAYGRQHDGFVEWTDGWG